MSVKEVFLEGNPPWGFRMNGGADAGHPLRISRVNPGSKAEAKGVREGDLITSINGQSTKCLTNSESHALLRTVKENLLLGLNEDKNASPRRRSREIKSASILGQEKERSESPTQHKGKHKSSECQRRHQRRTRLKHRIKGFFGLKPKEKKETGDEGWIIIDSSMNSHETRSVSEIGTDDETKWSVSQPEDDIITNNSEEIYDNFVFKKNHESSLTSIPNTSQTSEKKLNVSLSNGNQRTTSCEDNTIKDSKMVVKVIDSARNFDQKSSESSPQINPRKIDPEGKKISIDFIEHERKLSDKNDLWILRDDYKSQYESKALICQSEDFSETLNAFPPNEVIEVCNATVMIEEDNQRSQQLQMPLIVTDEEEYIKSPESNHCVNLDYEPVEVASSVIVYPPYGTTLSYYFPQRRYLEVISEENSDLSESMEEKQDKFDKPWENPEMIRKANDIPSIPNDWLGSDDGIDTSWRDGKSLEEVSDVAAVSDSFSDSDLLSEDLKLNRGVDEDGTVKYSISKVSEPNQRSSKHNVVLGKPPIIVNTYKVDTKPHSIYKGFDRFSRPNGTINDVKLKIKRDELKIKDNKKESPINKVTCRVLRQDEILSNTAKKAENTELHKSSTKNICGVLGDEISEIGDDNIAVGDKVFKKFVSLEVNNTQDLSKLTCKAIEKPSVNSIDKTADTSLPLAPNASGTNLNQDEDTISPFPQPIKPLRPEKQYMKSIPSSTVLKNVVLSYYSGSSEKKEADIIKRATDSHIEFSTAVIEPNSEKDIELIYIDSSDSDALSDANKNIFSSSNRTSAIFEKDNISVLDEQDCASTNDHTENIVGKKNHLIKEEIININQSVKNISDICSSFSSENMAVPSMKNKSNQEPQILPNLLSPVLSRKSLPKINVLKKRRFSYPMSEQDLLKTCHETNCYNCSNTAGLQQPIAEGKSLYNESTAKFNLTHLISLKQPKIQDSPKSSRKLSLRSLPNTPPPYIYVNTPSRHENQSTESILLEFSDGSVSSESYTLPDITQDNDMSDASSDTIKYFHISSNSTKNAPCSSLAVSEIVDLHKKFVERRGYHEVSPILKKKSLQGPEKTPEPDLISLSKCREQSEFVYTPELLAEAANLLALHKYHESRQRKMKSDTKNEIKSVRVSKCIDEVEKEQCKTTISKKFDDANKTEEAKSETNKHKELTSEKGLNGKIIDLKQVNKSVSTENETVGKSRLLELFQKLESKSSTTEHTLSHSESIPCCLILGDNLDLETFNNLSKEPGTVISNNAIVTERISNQKHSSLKKEEDTQICDKEEPIFSDKESSLPEKLMVKNSKKASIFVIHPASIPPGEIFQQKMYEEYLGKMAELVERRNMKVIKVSSIPNTVNLPCENQLLESEFMNKLKERNEKLGITIDGDEIKEKIAEDKDEGKKLPKHLKELMEITEECGGVWSPAQTPEAERKKFDFASEIREEKEREKQKEEEEKQEPTPSVWTPRSAGPSPTLERKFRTVNFQSPPPSRKEIKTPNETPKLPKDLPIDSYKENNSKSRLITSSSENRLTSSSSENSTLSSSLRLPTAQNPTITLLQKAREGQIPRGAQYLEDQPTIGPNDIIYSVKKEHVSEDKKIVELGPRKIEGIGPTTDEGIPTVLRSEVKEDNQQRWYKRMYDSLHKADADKDFVTVKYRTRRGQYPYSHYFGGYSSEPERIGYDSDASLSKYATLDRRKIRNKENDFTTSTMPRNRFASGVKYAVDVYKNQPGRIEDYEPGNSSISDKEKKQWWDEVMDIFDGEVNDTRSNNFSSKYIGKPYTYSLKDTGYESDSTLIFKRRENNMSGQLLSPTEQKMAYKVIQKGGEVPFQGLRKTAPERPKEPLGNSIPTPPRDSASRQRIQESPHRYVESEVNIHYKSPVRREAKAAWPEDELAQRQAEIMRRIYQEQKRTKYLNELHDMYSRRHADNLLPSQKSPIPLNRYDDFPVEVQPPRPRDRTPEPKLVARALYNFVGQTSRELSFRRGDIIYVRRQIDKNWYEGEHNAMIGLFPFNYVEIIPYDGIRTLPKKANEGQARAKFNFQAQTHLELSLVKGELVLLTRRVDENWFEGRIGKRKGIFPVSYVEVLVEPGERSEVPSRGGTPSKPLVAPASHSVMLNGAKDLGQQHYQPPRPIIYSSSSLPPSSKIHDISLVNQTLHIDTHSDPVPYRVLYNYIPKNDDELELKEGDVVYVMEKCDDGWYVGSLHRNGQFGTFPGNFVERIQ